MISYIKKNIFVIITCAIGVYLVLEIALRIFNFKELKKETLKAAIPTVSVLNPLPPSPTETISLPGTLKAWYEAPIYAQVSGYVKVWYKDYGSNVKKGDVLAEIQAPALDAEFQQAKADYESQVAKYQLADVTANRYLSLQKTNAVSDQAISVAVADKNSEKAKLVSAKKNLQKYDAMINFKKIIAPYNGILTQRNINVGDYINKDGNISDTKEITNLFTVSEIHKMRLFVSVPSSFSYLLKKGLTAEVIIAQFPENTYKAEFLTISKGFDPNTQTVLAEFVMENKDYKIWPGSYATVNFTAPIKKDLLTISASALIFNEKGIQVALLTDENKIHFKNVKINKIIDSDVEIIEGINPSDKVINNPRTSFLEGDLVRVVKPRDGY